MEVPRREPGNQTYPRRPSSVISSDDIRWWRAQDRVSHVRYDGRQVSWMFS
jgi:hypothetical protein